MYWEEVTIYPRRRPRGAPPARLGVDPKLARLVAGYSREESLQLAAESPVELQDRLFPVATPESLFTAQAQWGLRIGLAPPSGLLELTLVATRLEGLVLHPAHPLNRREQWWAERPDRELKLSTPKIVLPRHFPATRDYLVATTCPAGVVPLSSLVVIDTHSMLTFGLVSSRAFWVWTQVVGRNVRRATTLTAFNTFPFSRVDKKERFALETAANSVAQARMNFLVGSLRDLYSNMPRPLRNAHDRLDEVVNDLLGVPQGSSDHEIGRRLHMHYRALL